MDKGVITAILVVLALVIVGLVIYPQFNATLDMSQEMAMENERMQLLLQDKNNVKGSFVREQLQNDALQITVDMIDDNDDFTKAAGSTVTSGNLAVVDDQAYFRKQKTRDANGEITGYTFTQIDLSKTE